MSGTVLPFRAERLSSFPEEQVRVAQKVGARRLDLLLKHVRLPHTGEHPVIRTQLHMAISGEQTHRGSQPLAHVVYQQGETGSYLLLPTLTGYQITDPTFTARLADFLVQKVDLFSQHLPREAIFLGVGYEGNVRSVSLEALESAAPRQGTRYMGPIAHCQCVGFEL